MKAIGFGIVIGAIGLTKSIKPIQDDKASISINWSNDKGETKVFKIDDIEQDLGNEKIHSKTLLQKYVKQSTYPSYRVNGKSLSCSREKSFKKLRGTRQSDCDYDYDDASCSPMKCKTGKFLRKDCSRSASRDSGIGFCKPCGYEKCEQQPIVIEHKPIYEKNVFCKPGKRKQNKYHRADELEKMVDKDNSCEKCYNKDYDKKVKKLKLNDLLKLLKLNKENKMSKSLTKKNFNKARKNKSLSKYLKDSDAKSAKQNRERSCSQEDIKKLKTAKQDRDSCQDSKDNEKAHAKEMKKVHDIMNIANKKNEALLMNEKNKDNLHSSDKVIEEFDKLEHFKKVQEKCRSASKARKAHVKKQDCLDKEQKHHAGEKNFEKRFNKKLKTNKNKSSNDFDYCDQDKQNRNSKYLKDNNEFDKACQKERELSKSKCYDKSDFDNSRKNLDECSECDYAKKDKKKCKNLKKHDLSDDVNWVKKNRNTDKSRCNDECEEDKCYN